MAGTELWADGREVLSVLGARGFVALPTEEWEPLLGAFELHTERPSSAVRLESLALVHHNHRFLVRGASSLGVRRVLEAEGEPPLFASEELMALAEATGRAALGLATPYDLRCAGIVLTEDTLALTMVFRLRSLEQLDALATDSDETYGATELSSARPRLDEWSRWIAERLAGL